MYRFNNANGTGKSTLIKLLSGELKQQGGELSYSQGVKMGYRSASIRDAASRRTPLQHMMQIAPKHTGTTAWLSRQLWLPRRKSTDKVAPFSGGEKARLVLASQPEAQKPNLLLPWTNQPLDLDKRQALTFVPANVWRCDGYRIDDRYLLRATTDDLYLVPWPSGCAVWWVILTITIKWLTEQQKIGTCKEACQLRLKTVQTVRHRRKNKT